MSDEDLIKLFVETYDGGGLKVQFPGLLKALRAVFEAGAASAAPGTEG